MGAPWHCAFELCQRPACPGLPNTTVRKAKCQPPSVI